MSASTAHRWVIASGRLAWLVHCANCFVTRRTHRTKKCPHVHPDRRTS